MTKARCPKLRTCWAGNQDTHLPNHVSDTTWRSKVSVAADFTRCVFVTATLSVFLSLAGAAISIIFVATKVLSLQNTSFVATKVCLPPQNVCRDKIMFVATKHLSCQIFVATNTCLSRQMFCRTSILLSRQKKVFCRNNSKFMFVATKSFVATSML